MTWLGKRRTLQASRKAIAIVRQAPAGEHREKALATLGKIDQLIRECPTLSLWDIVSSHVEAAVVTFRYFKILWPCVVRAKVVWNHEPTDEFLAAHYPLEWNRAQGVLKEYADK